VNSLSNTAPDAVYAARDLIDFALEGHHLFNDTVFDAVHRLWERYGWRARELLNDLPDVPAYSRTDEVIAEWEREIERIENRLDRERVEADRVRQAYVDRHQLKFPWS
jgi:hypothetical protein